MQASGAVHAPKFVVQSLFLTAPKALALLRTDFHRHQPRQDPEDIPIDSVRLLRNMIVAAGDRSRSACSAVSACRIRLCLRSKDILALSRIKVEVDGGTVFRRSQRGRPSILITPSSAH
jgi:hypothetical protein